MAKRPPGSPILPATGWPAVSRSWKGSVMGSFVEGHVTRGFEPVRAAFKENFARRREVGAAGAAFVDGEKVVDRWGSAVGILPRPLFLLYLPALSGRHGV
jgi:hypothetical protein